MQSKMVQHSSAEIANFQVFIGQVENSDVLDISDFSDQIVRVFQVRVFQVRVFLLALCSNLKTRTSPTNLSDFLFALTIEFLLCTRRKLGHVGTRKSGLLGRKGPTFPCVKITEFLSFFRKAKFCFVILLSGRLITYCSSQDK